MNSIKELETHNENIQVIEGGISSPIGFLAGGLHCGIKRKRYDLGWIYSDVPATVGAVYTTNLFQAPPILVTKESIGNSKNIQGVIVNSGVANACTGEEGLKNAYIMRKLFADQVGIDEQLVAVSSTGVIGDHLPMEKIKNGVASIFHLDEQNHSTDFEQAILTTDTFTKHACVQMFIDGKKITIGGAAKGSGMIHPNMATMLSFITTDAFVNQEALQQVLKSATNKSFNMITVDGDTSTNDMVLVLANGQSKNNELSPLHPEWKIFEEGLNIVCQSLAKQIAKDGEGATKLIEAQVIGATSDEDAIKIAKSIIGSNLVKAAIFGEDPNWGRIVAAIGYSGATIKHTNIKVNLGPITVVEHGLPCQFSEEDAKNYLHQNEMIHIFVDLFESNGRAIAWGCDLTYDYVKINASYRT
ncbi:bifunctional ornithine acetyltransferase/N-acetylglutamate synthase [Heyndrickxia sporothermodurans]